MNTVNVDSFLTSIVAGPTSVSLPANAELRRGWLHELTRVRILGWLEVKVNNKSNAPMTVFVGDVGSCNLQPRESARYFVPGKGFR